MVEQTLPKLRTWARSAFVGSSQQMLSELTELIYRGFFAPVKPFWTVLDPIEHLSPGESAV